MSTWQPRIASSELIFPWLMDRGIPTEAVLAEMRAAEREMFYLVGTPRGRVAKYDALHSSHDRHQFPTRRQSPAGIRAPLRHSRCRQGDGRRSPGDGMDLYRPGNQPSNGPSAASIRARPGRLCAVCIHFFAPRRLSEPKAHTSVESATFVRSGFAFDFVLRASVPPW